MAEPLRIGFVGLDTSHVTAFASILNDPSHPHHVPGGRVVGGYSEVSADFELSWSRADRFASELREKYGVRIHDSIESLAESADLLFIESVDGRVHLDQFRRTVRFRRPTFIDKPFAVSLADAREILRLAEDAGVPVMSSSSLRYAEQLQAELAAGTADIVGCDAFGPMSEQPTQPGLFWYGIHTMEMIVATMGVGCAEVRAVRNDGCDLITMIWQDGRMASLRGLRGAHSRFGMVVHRRNGWRAVDGDAGRPAYAGLLAAVMRSLPQGRSDVPAEQTLEIVRIIEAANRSRLSGETVRP